jgi:phosphoadenosine phosphosulfate reductase
MASTQRLPTPLPPQPAVLSLTDQSIPAWQQQAPITIVQMALVQYPNLLMTSAFNLNGMVLLDVAAQAGYLGEVVFVDTGYHFAETLATRDAVAKRYPQLKIITLTNTLPDDQLYLRDPDACCAARKVAPLEHYLAIRQPSALLNARSREQASTRSEIAVIEAGKTTQDPVRIHPLAHQTQETLEEYAKDHDLPVNPLYWQGFRSIGCWPCTRAIKPSEDLRAGRWSGQGKSECGIWK